MSGGAGVLEELAVKLGLDADEASFFKAGALLDLVHQGIEKIAEIAKEAYQEIANLAPETANYARSADLAAMRTGLTVEAFQEMQFAAREAGISAEGLEGALFRMSRAAYEAKTGGGEAAAAFKGLLSLQDLKTLKPDEMFMKLAESLSHVADTGKRNDEVMRIFGRGMGAEIIPLLSKGSEGLAELRKEAHTFGKVLDSDTLAAAERFRVNNVALDESIEGLKLQLGGEILKSMGDWKKGLADAINAARPAVVHALRFALEKLRAVASSLKSVFQALREQWKSIAEALLTMLVPIGLVQIGLVVLNGWFWVVAAAAVRAGYEMLAAWVKAAAPVLAIVAILGLVFLALEDIYTFFQGGDSVFGDFIFTLKDMWASAVYYLKGKWGEFKTWFFQTASEIGAYLLAAITAPFNSLKDLVAKIPGMSKLMGGDLSASFGGGSSPQAAAASSTSSSTTNGGDSKFSVQMQVNVPPGTNPTDVGNATVGALDDWHATIWQATHAGVGGAR